jgi:phosphatidylinositol kinase/protein kinase (PI-3  family)
LQHVSPLNDDCGIIEWVPDVTTLRHILNELYAKMNPNFCE